MDKKREIKTENVRMVGLRYFSEADKGIELSNDLGYAFVVKVGESLYVNPFSPLETYPIFERISYSNEMSNGEDFGTKVSLVCGEEKTGPCYVILKIDAKDKFEKDTVTIEEMEDYILNSPCYFVDRHDIALARLGKHPVRMKKILKADEKSYGRMVGFFEERSVQIQKVNSKK